MKLILLKIFCSVPHTHVNENMLDTIGKIDYDKFKLILFEMPTYRSIKTGDIIGNCIEFGKAYKNIIKKHVIKLYKPKYVKNK